MIAALALGGVVLAATASLSWPLLGLRRQRRSAKERLRPLALAFVRGGSELRPQLSGRDSLVFAELIDEIAEEIVSGRTAAPGSDEPPAVAVEATSPPAESVSEEDTSAAAAPSDGPAEPMEPVPEPEESELVVRASVLAKRELALARLHATVAEREKELAERETEFAARSREVQEAEQRLTRAAARLHERAVAIEQREVALAARERSLALPTPGAEAHDQAKLGMWDLATLEQLVDEGGSRHPDRADEWRYYLLYLRGHSTPDGRLPASFDWLVAEVFAELLEPAAANGG
jgi:hypothetical protein